MYPDGQTKQAVINFSASGATTIIAGVAGQRINIMKLMLVTGGATTLTMQDTASALSGPLPLLANGAIVLTYDGCPWFTTAAGAGFQINSTAAVAVGGTIQYQLVLG